jgi:hypothetical protein
LTNFQLSFTFFYITATSALVTAAAQGQASAAAVTLFALAAGSTVTLHGAYTRFLDRKANLVNAVANLAVSVCACTPAA